LQLYEQVVTTGKFETALSKCTELASEAWRRLRSEMDHELRAALICLLTAALVAQGTAAIVGEPEGGWLSLPPWATSQPRAKHGLERAARAMAVKGQLLERSPSY
jgi:predicted metal-dependent hydrolase